jgi:hypothetical protein
VTCYWCTQHPGSKLRSWVRAVIRCCILWQQWWTAVGSRQIWHLHNHCPDCCVLLLLLQLTVMRVAATSW